MPVWDVKEYLATTRAQRVANGFRYNSGENSDWVTIEELRQLIKEHVTPSFNY
jgi:hypothetical protein